MILIKAYRPILSASILFALVLALHVDQSFAYSNRLLRFARNEGLSPLPEMNNKPWFPMHLFDMFTGKRTGLDDLETPMAFFADGKLLASKYLSIYTHIYLYSRTDMLKPNGILFLILKITDNEDRAMDMRPRRASMRLRRLRRANRLQNLKRANRLQNLKRADRLQRLRREDGDRWKREEDSIGK